jgi:hypothetical protein
VDHHRWGDVSEEEIRKLIEKKTPKKCCIEYPVTVIIYCQTDRSFNIFDIFKYVVTYLHYKCGRLNFTA